jgi:hypothetical protein
LTVYQHADSLVGIPLREHMVLGVSWHLEAL